MKNSYQDFLKKGIDLAPLGIAQDPNNTPYFCTPKGARIIGWAGVDGIHYCLIRGFGEMVFAVSPMNEAPHYVHLLAYHFSDFLRLLLACGDSAALEQAWQWDAEQFAAFLAQNPLTEEQKALLMQITEQTGLSSMEEPWQYLRDLQRSFDCSKIPYTEDFYDPEMNPDAPQQEPEWKVYFEGNFWGNCGQVRSGKELEIRKEFTWAEHYWLIPSLYVCGKGLVMDFCIQVEPSAIRDFREKWGLDLDPPACRNFTQEQRMQMHQENPLNLDFSCVLHLNGKELDTTCGYSTAYTPCVPPEYEREDRGKKIAEHYGLDCSCGWIFCRLSYPWATKRKPEIHTLSITLTQDVAAIPGPHFQVEQPGDTFTFYYKGQKHCLTVQEYEAQTMDWSGMQDSDREYPSHYIAMSYTLTPELPQAVMSIADCEEGDPPRQAPSAPGQPEATSCAMVVGIIGGEDGPTAIFFGPDKQGSLHAACSSLHFQPVEQVEWRIVFYEKQFEDRTVELLPV